MSQAFFDELDIPQPKYHLEIGSGPHGLQTGRMLQMVESVLMREQPSAVLTYGDTNSTLAGALAAAKMCIPIVHVEAGLRSFDRSMPEEINRVTVDHLSDVLLAPTSQAMANLSYEGLTARATLCGDVMVDALLHAVRHLDNDNEFLREMGMQSNGYVLLTVHRPSNVDNLVRLREILSAVACTGIPVLFPVHPRTAGRIRDAGIVVDQKNIKTVAPLSYSRMLMAERNSLAIITDSGGVQKEAYVLRIPCITLRSETEWGETCQTGWNVLAPDVSQLNSVLGREIPNCHPAVYGNGDAAQKVVACIMTLDKGL